MRYFAWLYSPARERQLFQTLVAIESEVAGSLRPDLDHNVAHVRLQWWREEFERAAAGHAVHPFTRQAGAIDLSGFTDNATWDLAGATFETRAELTGYCDRWATAMIEPIAASSGGSARALGAALRESEMLLNLARDARAGRLRLPLDELERAGIDPADLARVPVSTPLANLLRSRFQTLHRELSEASASVNTPVRAALRGILAWAALAQRQLRRAEQALPELPRIQRFDALAQSWLAWRTARRVPEVSA
jgi:phytoene synthase